MIKDIRIDQYDYPLPDGMIARHPLAVRDACRLLVRRPDGSLHEAVFRDLPSFVPADAMLVYNNTRVINARLRFRKGDSAEGALIEIFCLEPVEPVDYNLSFASVTRCSWRCFVGNSKRWKDQPLSMAFTTRDGVHATLTARRAEKEGAASIVEFSWVVDGPATVPSLTFSEVIEAVGEIPIPPYLNRSTEESDRSDYQTVFSHIEGSVAAPTAGLHFTEDVLRALDLKGISRREITLHVGAGTFQPVKNDTIGEHEMHSEFISVDRSLIEEIAAWGDRPLFAVGTTSVRTLESVYQLGRIVKGRGKLPDELPQWTPYDPDLPVLSRSEAFAALAEILSDKGLDRLVATTRLMIAPGYRYGVVDGIVTNFHQPRSTLLLLVSAFVGGDWRPLYDYALSHDFRFLSYGDATLLLR